MTITRVVEDARPALESGIPPAQPRGERRPELDLMRAFVVAGLIVEHAAVVFVSTDGWFVNDRHPNVGFGIFATWASTWGMPLLMVVSGMGVRYALRRRSAQAFVQERLARLGVPFVVGMVALVPPMWYLRQLRGPDFHMSYWRFWLRFFDLPAMMKGLPLRAEWSSGGMVFDPAHLWFLYVLLVFSMVLLPVFLYLRSPRGSGLVDRVAGLVGRHGLLALGTFAAPVVLAEAVFGANDNTGAWDRTPFLFFLLYGFLIATDGRFEAALRRGRRVALAAAFPASLVLIFWAGAIDTSGGELMNGSQTGWSALQALTGWLWIVAILGYASAIVSGRSRRSSAAAPSRSRWSGVGRYANEAALPFYVLHLPVIVCVAWFVVRWNAFIAVKYFTVVVVSFAGTLALYELLVRRYRITRLLFGMKAVRPARDSRRRTVAPREVEASGSTEASGLSIDRKGLIHPPRIDQLTEHWGRPESLSGRGSWGLGRKRRSVGVSSGVSVLTVSPLLRTRSTCATSSASGPKAKVRSSAASPPPTPKAPIQWRGATAHGSPRTSEGPQPPRPAFSPSSSVTRNRQRPWSVGVAMIFHGTPATPDAMSTSDPIGTGSPRSWV